MVHSLRHSTTNLALFNDANPTRVQKIMRQQHYATMEMYVEEVQRLLERGGGGRHADLEAGVAKA